MTRSDGGLTEKQIDSLRQATGMVNIWEGAVSSGKTVASIYRFLMHVVATHDRPGEVIITGRTRDSVWRNVILPAMQLYPGMIVGNMGAPSCWIASPGPQVRAHVIGASDAKAESVIRGITAKSIYIDEVTTIQESYFAMALSRLRVAGKNGALISKLFGSTNPDNPMHWLRRDYLLRIGEDPEITRSWRSFHFRLEDNPRLSPEYVENMKAQFTGLFYRRFILGEWVQGEGTIWDTWDPDTMAVDVSDLPRMEKILTVGVDFGSTHRSAGLLLGLAEERLWVLSEWSPVTGLAPSIQSHHFREWLAQQPAPWRDPEFIHVDSAAKAFRDQLFTDGLPTAPAWKDVNPGIQLVHSLISTDRLRVLDSCTNLLQEMPGYVWDSDASDRGVDAPVKENDDFCDALRYAIFSSRPQWQGFVPLQHPTASDEVHASRQPDTRP